MTTRHTPGTTGMSGTAAPWQERQLSSGAKLGLLTLAALLLIILLVSLLVFIGVGGAFLRGETDPQERTADIIGLAVVAGLFFAGLAGLIFVWPRAGRHPLYAGLWGDSANQHRPSLRGALPALSLGALAAG